jgi:hypothetical protein
VERRRFDSTLLILTLTALIATLGSPVNPYPTDGWYQTQYLLVASFPGADDYTPIAAPALLYRGAHALAVQAGLGLGGEFYIASVLQNVLVLLSACMVYFALRGLRLKRLAAPVAIALLLFILSTGLPQAFWSENATLFLTAALLLIVVVLLYGPDRSPARFWVLAVVGGLLVGLLVVTRMTPVFLIPGIALLFFRRLPLRQVLQFTGTLALITLLMMVSTVLANHVRFGRYELTNGSGRHLWQGMKDFSDRALADSPDYQALKTLDPNVQGKNWWEVPPVPRYQPSSQHHVPADAREPLLAKLSKQGIRNAPGLYLAGGARKFLRSIGSVPYRLGYDTFGVWNPLNRSELLPPLASSMRLPAAYNRAVAAVFSAIYATVAWLYPISIFAIALSCLAKAVVCLQQRRWRRRGRTRDGATPMMPLMAFAAGGLLLAALPIASGGRTVPAFTGSAFCLLLLGLCTAVLRRRLRQQSSESSPQRSIWERGIPFFLVLVLLFFGSLWFSWQIEVANARNALPLLPLWSIMLAIVLSDWNDLWTGVTPSMV